jgi:hypothetical protein
LTNRLLTQTILYLRQNALAAIALFVALGGTGYAAAGLPSQGASTRKASVAAAPLRAHGQVVAWAIVNGKGHAVAGNPWPRVQGGGGVYTVRWRGIPTSTKRKQYCASPVTVDNQFSSPDVTLSGQPAAAGYADATNLGHAVYVATFNPGGQPTPLAFEVALIC